MSREWVSNTCEHCEYRIGRNCRYMPPVIDDERCFKGIYTTVKHQEDFSPACAQYKDIEEGEA